MEALLEWINDWDGSLDILLDDHRSLGCVNVQIEDWNGQTVVEWTQG